MINILEESKKIEETIIKHRRYIHENAEISDQLPITTEYVITKLREMGYNPKEISKSAVVATVGKKSGKTILLRADMDALPIVEESELEFKSKTEYMHACGHDMHTAMLLGAAEVLKKHEDEIEGQVKLMFQPAEETLLGAKAMVEAGVLENPKVDAAMMIHVFSGMPIPSGTIIVPDFGVLSAASDWFEIKVQGKGGHGAMPNDSIDPLNVISHIHLALQEINAREIAPGDRLALTVGQMHGGNTSNVIPDTGFLAGTLRTFNEETRNFVKKRMEEISEGIAHSFRAKATVSFSNGCPSAVINEKLRKQTLNYLIELLGQEKVIEMEKVLDDAKMSGSEDFAFVSEKVPSIMLILGAGSSQKGYIYPQHHPKVRFDEDALAIGTSAYVNTAIKWLKDNK